MTTLQTWFEDAKGCRVQEIKSGEIFKIEDLREGATTFIGLVSEGGTLLYVTLDRFMDFASVD